MWSQDAGDPSRVHFTLSGDPAELGIEFRGDVTLEGADEVRINLYLTNCLGEELRAGRHLIHLDMRNLPDFLDPAGHQTYFHTDGGWRTRSDLFREAGITHAHHAVRVGSQLGRSTVIWDLAVRADSRRHKLVALSLNRAFAFTTDHPDWGPGIQVACRWGPLAPGERQHAIGTIYLADGDLYQLEERYVRNRKRR